MLFTQHTDRGWTWQLPLTQHPRKQAACESRPTAHAQRIPRAQIFLLNRIRSHIFCVCFFPEKILHCIFDVRCANIMDRKRAALYIFLSRAVCLGTKMCWLILENLEICKNSSDEFVEVKVCPGKSYELLFQSHLTVYSVLARFEWN